MSDKAAQRISDAMTDFRFQSWGHETYIWNPVKKKYDFKEFKWDSFWYKHKDDKEWTKRDE